MYYGQQPMCGQPMQPQFGGNYQQPQPTYRPPVQQGFPTYQQPPMAQQPGGNTDGELGPVVDQMIQQQLGQLGLPQDQLLYDCVNSALVRRKQALLDFITTSPAVRTAPDGSQTIDPGFVASAIHDWIGVEIVNPYMQHAQQQQQPAVDAWGRPIQQPQQQPSPWGQRLSQPFQGQAPWGQTQSTRETFPNATPFGGGVVMGPGAQDYIRREQQKAQGYTQAPSSWGQPQQQYGGVDAWGRPIQQPQQPVQQAAYYDNSRYSGIDVPIPRILTGETWPQQQQVQAPIAPTQQHQQPQFTGGFVAPDTQATPPPTQGKRITDMKQFMKELFTMTEEEKAALDVYKAKAYARDRARTLRYMKFQEGNVDDLDAAKAKSIAIRPTSTKNEINSISDSLMSCQIQHFESTNTKDIQFIDVNYKDADISAPAAYNNVVAELKTNFEGSKKSTVTSVVYPRLDVVKGASANTTNVASMKSLTSTFNKVFEAFGDMTADEKLEFMKTFYQGTMSFDDIDNRVKRMFVRNFDKGFVARTRFITLADDPYMYVPITSVDDLKFIFPDDKNESVSNTVKIFLDQYGREGLINEFVKCFTETLHDMVQTEDKKYHVAPDFLTGESVSWLHLIKHPNVAIPDNAKMTTRGFTYQFTEEGFGLYGGPAAIHSAIAEDAYAKHVAAHANDEVAPKISSEDRLLKDNKGYDHFVTDDEMMTVFAITPETNYLGYPTQEEKDKYGTRIDPSVRYLEPVNIDDYLAKEQRSVISTYPSPLAIRNFIDDDGAYFRFLNALGNYACQLIEERAVFIYLPDEESFNNFDFTTAGVRIAEAPTTVLENVIMAIFNRSATPDKLHFIYLFNVETGEYVLYHGRKAADKSILLIKKDI